MRKKRRTWRHIFKCHRGTFIALFLTYTVPLYLCHAFHLYFLTIPFSYSFLSYILLIFVLVISSFPLLFLLPLPPSFSLLLLPCLLLPGQQVLLTGLVPTVVPSVVLETDHTHHPTTPPPIPTTRGNQKR